MGGGQADVEERDAGSCDSFDDFSGASLLLSEARSELIRRLQGGFDHTVNSNAVLRRAEFDFAPRSLDDFFEEVAVRKEWEK